MGDASAYELRLVRFFRRRGRSPERDTGGPEGRFRHVPSHPVQVHVLGANSLDILNARDVSLTGLGIYVPHCFEGCDIDSDVELVISLPQRKSFVAMGRIRHRTETGWGSAFFGVQFTRIGLVEQDALRDYLDSDLVEPVPR